MKTTKTYLLILFTVLLFAANQCQKEDLTKLPPETQTGANTFGCYVDGELFIKAKDVFLSPTPRSLSASYDKKNKDFYIRAYSAGKVDFISMRLNEAEVNIPKPISETSVTKNVTKECWNFSGEEVGEIIITKLDTINNIASGRFRFQAQALCIDFVGDSIVFVTDGRFDVKLNVY